MKNPATSSRRKFIEKSALAIGAITIVPRHVLGRGFIPPSDIFSVGIIGTGAMGKGLANRFEGLEESRVIAVCDIDKKKLESFKESYQKAFAEIYPDTQVRDLPVYSDYAQLLDRTDIDGVVVSTPDHWHAAPAIDAMKAGKHVYCEKPMSHTIKEGRAMADASKKYGKILQTGSQQRSNEEFRKACELVRNGYVGEITKVLVNVGNPASPCNLPYHPTPDYIDWDRWVGSAPMRSFHPTLTETDWFPRWRWFREFGGGILADWGAHMFDIAQWGLGMDGSGPVEIVPPREPNAVKGLKMIYANGVEMIHEDFCRGYAVRFIGSEGSLDVSRSFLDSDPENIVTATLKEGDVRLYKSENHHLDWINSIKEDKKPICDVEIGHRSSSVCHLANIGYELRRALRWDPEKEEFIGDAEANFKRSKFYRKPYLVAAG